MPKVTICVPTYNSEDTIDACLASALEQSYGDFECLVVDNASTDGTLERVARIDDARIRVVRNPVNIGPNANHNRCIDCATGELIQFLHADDRLFRNCLSLLAPTFENPRVGLAFAPRRIDPPDTEWARLFGTLHTPLEPLQPVNDGKVIIRKYVGKGSLGNWIGEPTSVMVRRAALREVGGFRTELRYADDMDLWIRILARYDAAWVDKELSLRTENDDMLTAGYARDDEAWMDRLWILSGIARNGDLDRRVRFRARLQWVDAVLRRGVRVQLSPKDIRRTRNRELGRHVVGSLAEHRVPLGKA
ncbi:glycosyltransferase family 2 protein [Mycolicibacterium goodii]|uniref:Glycosyltransferase n=1 Tax=Mycolicibacterium goodii TaxID=134601 RepID=A0ABS6HM99_MYCGD|nr:glycosyltransferase [Mycolicibacterium goodii]MBU8823755.1 glycosyltransferase [Mycolicibacterium goodii]MBU8835927.1 glycosyltransferase [Mycolicibacterium goodii]